MAPFSYQPPTRGDKAGQQSHSQSAESNLSHGQSTVAKLLEAKGDAIFAIRPNDTVGHAVEALRDKRIGALVVTDQNGALQGILSERDIVRELSKEGAACLDKPVSGYMTRELVTCTTQSNVGELLKQMTEGRFRHMPVVEEGKLIGLVSLGDVVKAQLAEVAMEKDALEGMIMGH